MSNWLLIICLLIHINICQDDDNSYTNPTIEELDEVILDPFNHLEIQLHVDVDEYIAKNEITSPFNKEMFVKMFLYIISKNRVKSGSDSPLEQVANKLFDEQGKQELTKDEIKSLLELNKLTELYSQIATVPTEDEDISQTILKYPNVNEDL
jgi:hypothetical protein